MDDDDDDDDHQNYDVDYGNSIQRAKRSRKFDIQISKKRRMSRTEPIFMINSDDEEGDQIMVYEMTNVSKNNNNNNCNAPPSPSLHCKTLKRDRTIANVSNVEFKCLLIIPESR